MMTVVMCKAAYGCVACAWYKLLGAMLHTRLTANLSSYEQGQHQNSLLPPGQTSSSECCARLFYR